MPCPISNHHRLFSETGDQWLDVSISVDYNAESIYIEAGNKLVGQPFGDIAIDDVVVSTFKYRVVLTK